MILTQPRWGVFGRRYGSVSGSSGVGLSGPFAGKAQQGALPTPPTTHGGAAIGLGAGVSFRTTDEQKKRDVDIAVALLVISQ